MELPKFTIVLEWTPPFVEVSAFLENDDSTPRKNMVAALEECGERFEIFESVSRPELDQWLAEEAFSPLMDLSAGQSCGHTIAYFRAIPHHWDAGLLGGGRPSSFLKTLVALQ